MPVLSSKADSCRCIGVISQTGIDIATYEYTKNEVKQKVGNNVKNNFRSNLLMNSSGFSSSWLAVQKFKWRLSPKNHGSKRSLS